MVALSKTCKEIRKETDGNRASIAHAIDKGQQVIDRFERGQTWPEGRHIDQLVNAYADVTGVEASEIWERAIAAAKSADRTNRANAASEKAADLSRKRRQ